MIKKTLSPKLIFGCLLALFLAPDAIAQNDENAVVKLLANNDHAKAKALADEINRQHPGSALALYLQALVEKNADAAIKHYNDILLLHRSSPYAPKALYKVSQYYFVKGYYFSARKNFLDLIKHYPTFSFRRDASYYAAKCLLMTGKADSARSELEALLAEKPAQGIRELVVDDLQALQEEEQQKNTRIAEANPDLAPTAETLPPMDQPKNFTVQVGAFSRIENANSIKKSLTPQGYAVDIVRARVNRRYLYKVYVGRFAGQAEAEQFAVNLKAKTGLSYRIIQLEE